MASPNLLPVNFTANGDTFQYMVNLTNNLVSLANAGVYTNGVASSPAANVIIIGTISSTYHNLNGNTAFVNFYNDNSILTGQIKPNLTNNSIIISSSNAANKFELFANGVATIADVRVATIADLNGSSNTTNGQIAASANATLTAANAYTNLAVPSGTIIAYAGNTVPNSSWYEADGSAKSRTVDAALFAVVGTQFGAGDGNTTFNIPQLQGEFIRGWDHGRGVDSGRTFGSFQADAIRSHTHTGTTTSAGDHTHTASAGAAGGHTHSASADVQGNHAHGVNDPGHAHTILAGTGGASGDGYTSANVGNNRNTATAAAGTGISIQAAGAHSHNITVAGVADHVHTITLVNAGAHSHTFTTNSTGDVETRPRNVALMYIIRR